MEQLLSILHLEDDRDDAELIRRKIVAGGLACRITHVQTREDFLRELERGRFDLFLSDFTIPTFDGASALSLARRHAADVPFIFVSGTIGEDRAVESLVNGATDYVLKTGDMKRLVPAVQRALREARERRERRRLEEQYLQSQKMEAVGRLACGVAHDFNNLLTAIIGLGELVLRDFSQDDPRKKDVEEIVATGARAADLTQRLLAFSRKQIVAPRVVDVGGVVQGVEMMLRRIIGEHVELVFGRADGPLPVLIDPGQLEQVVVNLAVNARDAMAGGGRLEIETAGVELGEGFVLGRPEASIGRFARLRLRDSGAGMSAEVKAHLFEPFFTTKEAGKGTGLGLATCYGISRQNGGFIDVDSAPGRGTTVDVYLPLTAAAPVDVSRPSRGAPAPRGCEIVMVVEDEAPVRRLALRQLRELGYETREAVDGLAALAAIRADRERAIRLVLTDVVMPGIGGKAFADRIATERPDLKIVFASGYADETVIPKGVLAPGVLFLAKPYKMETLARMVREALDA